MTGPAQPAGSAFPATVTVPAGLAGLLGDQVVEAAASGPSRVLGALARSDGYEASVQ
jgi:hypothetical protein